MITLVLVLRHSIIHSISLWSRLLFGTKIKDKSVKCYRLVLLPMLFSNRYNEPFCISSFKGDFKFKFLEKWLQHWNEAQNQFLDWIYGQGRFNTLDSQKEGKHLYFSSELLEEKICYGITYTNNNINNNHSAPYLNPRWRIPWQVCMSYLN